MERMRASGDVSLAVHVEGDGPPVLFVHGFPDSGRVWRHQVRALADAGHRVIVPDLRGFGASDRPPEVQDYRLSHSVADLVAILDALRIDKAAVVAHDWGAGVAWVLAATRPERVSSLAALSIGHPESRVPPSVAQREKSWYMLLFQFEGVAEELLMRDDAALLREWIGDAVDVDAYVADLSRPGALTAGLNWYRANTHPALELKSRRGLPPVPVPTLGLWSTGDRYVLEEGMAGSGAHVTGGWRYERLEGPGHWLQLDAPQTVNALLLEHLRR
ncbi:MAG TPA: alpha/beta fold hydrolase [Solirubrobacteraceae bacterium]|nr:alpha/beta fold hydrolase [Solirubrobacteraceae bacterium]